LSEVDPPTEQMNVATRDLDLLSVPELVAVLVHENDVALAAVHACEPQIAQAVERIVARLAAGGTLHYIGAGTSGRLGFLDAAECPPTFGSPPGLVRAHIAGGSAALTHAVEGAEDDGAAGVRSADAAVEPADAVVGVSASGGAAFVVAALSRARERGALTVALTSAPNSALERACELAIVAATGAEAIAGSTRMKAGTAQKIVLSALSTAVMVRLGKVYDNLMVDVVASNEKLRRRALGLVARLVPAGPERARELLASAAGNVKIAVVMGRRGVDAATARGLLAQEGGRLRATISPAPLPP
jgi:N-acetylmuramic acid 6-phosphate etherase